MSEESTVIENNDDQIIPYNTANNMTYKELIGKRSGYEEAIIDADRPETGVYASYDNHGVVVSIEGEDTKCNFGSAPYVCIDKGNKYKHRRAQIAYLRQYGYGFSGGTFSRLDIVKDDRFFPGTTIWKWRIVHGKLVERSNEEYEIILRITNNKSDIIAYKRKLNDTDYIAAKIAEGAATTDEYAEQLNERQQWRDKINELENAIAADEVKYSEFDTDPLPIEDDVTTEKETDNG